MHDTRLANLVGATALTIADRLVAVATDAVGLSASECAALVTLAAESGAGVTQLAARIGLSQPGTVRMLDKLAARRLVERRPGTTGRSIAVHLTAAGHDVARTMLEAREDELARVVARLKPPQREALTAALEPLLDGLFDDVGSTYLICRLCDRGACTAEEQTCPVGTAARLRGGADE